MKSAFILTLILTVLTLLSTGTAFQMHPHSHQGQYNKTYSKYLNAYSAITHCNEQQITNWECRLCKQVEKPKSPGFYFNKAANILGYSGYLESLNVILVVWRGTIDARNWIEDFTFAQLDYPACKGCRVHEGFYLSYDILAKQVKTTIAKNVEQYPDARIVVIGSSMGGALALVNALDLVTNGFAVNELHVYGCPRTLNANLAQYLTQKVPIIWRVIHNRDIIPHVPLQMQNYHHPPFEVLFDENFENFKVCDESGEDPTCALALEPGVSIQDHITYWYAPIKEDLCTL